MPDAREHREQRHHAPTELARPAGQRPRYSQTQHLMRLVPRMRANSRPAPGTPQPAFTPRAQTVLPRSRPEYPPPQQPARGPRSLRNAAAAAAGAALVITAAALGLAWWHAGHGSTAGTSVPPPVSAVPGSNGNEYVTGPFTVTLTGIGPLPAKYDAVTPQGKPVPERCAVVNVKNTSAGYTGWVSPQVEFVKGHSLGGPVLGTAAADPTGGSSGGSSDPLSPGQSEVLYACPQTVSGSVYVEAQLTSVTYGTPDQGTLSGTTVRLKY